MTNKISLLTKEEQEQVFLTTRFGYKDTYSIEDLLNGNANFYTAKEGIEILGKAKRIDLLERYKNTGSNFSFYVNHKAIIRQLHLNKRPDLIVEWYGKNMKQIIEEEGTEHLQKTIVEYLVRNDISVASIFNGKFKLNPIAEAAALVLLGKKGNSVVFHIARIHNKNYKIRMGALRGIYEYLKREKKIINQEKVIKTISDLRMYGGPDSYYPKNGPRGERSQMVRREIVKILKLTNHPDLSYYKNDQSWKVQKVLQENRI